MVAVNEQEVPVPVRTTALMNTSNPFYTMHIYLAFSFVGVVPKVRSDCHCAPCFFSLFSEVTLRDVD